MKLHQSLLLLLVATGCSTTQRPREPAAEPRAFVVIDLEGIIVTPSVKATPGEDPKVIKSASGFQNERMPSAEQLVTLLALQPGVKVSFVPAKGVPDAHTSNLLQKLRRADANYTGSFLGLSHKQIYESDTKKGLDLTKVDSDLQRVVYLTTDIARVQDSQKSNAVVVKTSQEFFAAVSTLLDAVASQKPLLPAYKEYSLIPGYDKDPKTSQLIHTQYMEKALEAIWEKGFNEELALKLPEFERYEWEYATVNRTAIIGCLRIPKFKGAPDNNPKNALNKKDCVGKAFTHYEWLYDDAKKPTKVKGCNVHDRNGVIATETALVNCEKNKILRYYWAGAQRNECVALTKALVLYKTLKANECPANIEEHLITLKKDGSHWSFAAFDGMDKLTPEQLEAKVVGEAKKPAHAAAAQQPQNGRVSFVQFNRESPMGDGRIDDVKLPRVRLAKYRGTSEGQLDTLRAVRALFEDPSAILETKAVTGAKWALQKKPAPAGFDWYKRKGLEHQVKELLSQNGGAAYDESQAAELGAKVIEDYLETLDLEAIRKTYLFYSGKDVNGADTYVDWPQEIVFTSVYQRPARRYGDRLIVIRELSPRGVDLNYWNYMANGKVAPHGWADIGEYIIPGYVPAQDIDGYEYQPGGKSQLGFYRVFDGDNVYLLVVTPGGADCVARNGEADHVVFCRDRFEQNKKWPLLLERSEKQVPAWGFLQLVEAGGNCSVPNDLYGEHAVQAGKMPQNLWSSHVAPLIGKQILGKTVKFCPRN